MDTILEVARRHDLLVVEDAAQGVNATYKNRYLGTIAPIGTYSFHETKNFISGEGGALVINDEQFLERAEIIREKGTNRSQFFRGQVDKYTWVDVGSSYLPSEIVAAFLYAQLEEANTITASRWEVFRRYEAHFRPFAEKGLLQMPIWPDECYHNAHMFYVILPTRELRDGLITHLKRKEIQAVFHYVPLHSSPMGRRIGCGGVELPVTDDLSERLVRLPCYFGLTPEDQDRIADEIGRYLGVSS
jgi:dTDP-4-amino-4,6-dideoxygalactose transaminase